VLSIISEMPSYPIAELKSHIGESHQTVAELTVEAGKVEEFAHAIYDPKSEYLEGGVSDSVNVEGRVAPPTFLRTWYFQRYRPDGIETDYGFDLGLNPAHTIHGEQSYEFSRPVHVGDTLSAETTLTDVYQRTGDRGGTMTFVVFQTEFTDENDEIVACVENTRIETEGAIGGSDNE
jgi:acyl dehydratase